MVDTAQNLVYRQSKGMNGTLHTLENAHAHQIDQAAFTVDLLKDTAAYLGIITLAVFRPLFRQQIGQWRVNAERQPLNQRIDVADGRELVFTVHARIEVFRRQALGELPNFRNVVVFFNMLAAASNRDSVQQLEVTQIHHFYKSIGSALLVRQLRPTVEHQLCLAQNVLNAGNTYLGERVVLTLSNKSNLVFDIVHPIVDRRCGQH